jgi:hypothetical protein
LRRVQEASGLIKTPQSPTKAARPSRKRGALFEDPDAQFETLKDDSGGDMMKSTVPGLEYVLFNGKQYFTELPWEHKEKRPKKPIQEEIPLPEPADEPPEVPEEVPEPTEEETAPEGPMDIVDIMEVFPALSSRIQELIEHPGIDPVLKKKILTLLTAIASRILMTELEKIPVGAEIGQLVELDELKHIDIDAAGSAGGSRGLGHADTLAKLMGKRFAAFPHDQNRYKKPGNRMERQVMFCRDLATAVLEGENFMRPYRMRWVSDAGRQNALKDKTILKEKIKKKVRPRMAVAPPPPEPEGDLHFSRGTPRVPPHNVRPQTPVPVSLRRTAVEKPALPLASGKVGKMGTEVKTSRPEKRKPQFTKTTAVFPEKDPELGFGPPPKQVGRSVTSFSARWKVLKPEVITPSDLDMFMFITPYVIEPSSLVKIITEAEAL